MATSPLTAQPEVARSFEQLQALVEVGDHIRVISGPGRTVQGRIVSLSSSLVLSANDARLDLQEDDVSFIEQRGDPLWNGARWGLWVGSITGLACALFCFDLCIDVDDSDVECPPPGPPRTDAERWEIFLGTAALGAGVGAAIDWALRGWTLVYERPTRPTATATLSPIISGNDAGVRLTVGF